MWPDMFVMLNPFSNDDLSFPQAVEDFSIQKITYKGAVILSQKPFSQGMLGSM